jgi:hypothetical protein
LNRLKKLNIQCIKRIIHGERMREVLDIERMRKMDRQNGRERERDKL